MFFASADKGPGSCNPRQGDIHDCLIASLTCVGMGHCKKMKGDWVVAPLLPHNLRQRKRLFVLVGVTTAQYYPAHIQVSAKEWAGKQSVWLPPVSYIVSSCSSLMKTDYSVLSGSGYMMGRAPKQVHNTHIKGGTRGAWQSELFRNWNMSR